jgi:hypothetical protein
MQGDREQALSQTPVAHIHMPELALDHSERVFDIRLCTVCGSTKLLDFLGEDRLSAGSKARTVSGPGFFILIAACAL